MSTTSCSPSSTADDLLDDRQRMKFEFLFQHTAPPPREAASSSSGTPRRHSRTHRIVRLLLLAEVAYSMLAIGLISLSITISRTISDGPPALTHGPTMALLPRVALCFILTVNVLTALNVCCRMQDGWSCASTLMIHVIWKIILAMVLMPTVALFSFIRFEEYMHSWPSKWIGAKVLVLMWLYAVFSVFAIVLLSTLARGMWAKKARCRRSSVDSKISIIGATANSNSELVTLSSADLLPQA